MMEKEMSGEQTPAEYGAAILGRYRHPGKWVEGASTGKPHLRGKMLLKVEEIRLGGMGFVSEQEARINADAIRAFAEAHGIAPYKLTLEQVPGKAPYVVVPDQYFDEVITVLQSL